MVGVEKPGIRAIEHILRQPGLFPGKVGILCGGPDWPTSVMCGFLGQSRFQMCLGTTPISIICLPSVMAGCILNMPSDSLWGEFVPFALLFALLSQGCVVWVALYYINEVVASDDPQIQEFLTASRPEHEAVEKLSLERAAFDRVYRDVTEFSAQKPVQKILLVLSLLLGFGSAAAVTASGSAFFRPFEATSRISASYDNVPPGLEADPEKVSWPLALSLYNLIKMPNGWILLAFHVGSFILYYVWGKSVTSTAHVVLNADGARFKENEEKYEHNPHHHGDAKNGNNGVSESQQPLTDPATGESKVKL
jgi:hypothetical protein